MADDTLLSHLCGICYSQEPKYRCPGCSARTCSLPCYQKHRQRASCSGKRDPAAFVKKSQWATPAGIDRDYNYLRGIERALDHADHSSNAPTGLADSASSLTTATLKNVTRGRHPNSVLQRYLANHSITVQHAPLGMTRQKSNQTRPTKRNNVVWTVEWIAPQEDYRHLAHDCLESTALANLYASHRVDRGTKRKRGNPSPEDVNVSTKVKASESKDDASSTILNVTSTDADLAKETSQRSSPNPANSQPSPPQHAFYLLKPSTTSLSRILILLDPQASLTENLKDRVVQEYPTIYVFPATSTTSLTATTTNPSTETSDTSSHSHKVEAEEIALPRSFILEADYERQRQQEEKELEGTLAQTAATSSLPPPPRSTSSHDDPSRKARGYGRQEDAAVDAEGILAMLKKDVRGRRGM